MYTGMLSSLIVTFLWGIGVLAMFHLSGSDRRFRILSLTFTISLPAWFLLSMGLNGFVLPKSWSDPLVPDLLLGLATHIMLFFLVVECYYHIDRSVTFSILVTLLQHPAEGLDGSTIRAKHDISETIEDRVNTLRVNNYLTERTDRLELTRKGTFVALVTLASTWLFKSQLQKDRVE